jgi:hypothetical protein
LAKQLILKRAPIGWNQDDFDVVEDGVIVGRIFFLDAVGPQGRPRMWASGHNGETPRGVRLWSDARGCHGDVREELATRVRGVRA